MTCKDVVALSPLYLSGELDSTRAAEIGKHLEACATCARELREHQEIDARLRAAILDESVETSELERRVREHVARRRGYGRWVSAAASVAAALVVGWVLYRVSMPGSKLYADAAEDHRREVVEHQSRRWIFEGPAIDAMALAQGVPASGIHATESDGYRLERAKLCRLNGRIFLHLVYTDGARECSIFLRQREDEPVAEPANAGDLEGKHLAAFRTKALTAVVVTEQSRDAALQFARFAASAL
jgi:anti-sigma factor RsiW